MHRQKSLTFICFQRLSDASALSDIIGDIIFIILPAFTFLMVGHVSHKTSNVFLAVRGIPSPDMISLYLSFAPSQGNFDFV